jgi:hypothetical protein
MTLLVSPDALAAQVGCFGASFTSPICRPFFPHEFLLFMQRSITRVVGWWQGSTVQNPPAFFSHHGVLAVNYSYQTTSDVDGRTLFCFMTPEGLENPTLHVNPGDHLVINVTNNTPAAPVEMRIDLPNCGAAEMTGSSVNLHYHRSNTSPTWAVKGDTIFVEARNTATVNGKPIEWPAIYVVTLRAEMVIHGRPYYDRTEALMHFEPALVTNRPNAHINLLQGATPHGSSPSDSEAYASEVYEKIVAPYATNGKDPDPVKFQQFYAPDARMINPGFERPLRRAELPAYYTALKSQIRNLQLHLERWAVAPGLLFIEWTITGEIAGKYLVLPNTDRFTLRDMLATKGVAYFDDLALRAFTDPSLASFANVSFANMSTGNAGTSR